MISEEKVIPDYSYLTLVKKRPSAIGRVEIQNDRIATLTDFVIADNQESGGVDLISHILNVLRADRIEELTTWLHPNSDLVSEVLGTYLFEPTRIRSHIICSRKLSGELPDVDSSCQIIEGSSDNVIVPIPRTIKVGLQQIIYDIRKAWIFESRIILDDHKIDCYQSSKTRGEGWVDLKLGVIRDYQDLESCTNLISLAVRRLQKRGVKTIHGDIDSSSDIFGLFKANGFRKKTTFFEMIFKIEY